MRGLQSDANTDLFQLALGLARPWTISDVVFSKDEGKLDIYVIFPKGTRFPCPHCSQEHGVYDTVERTWRHLNFFQYEAYIHAHVPRIKCTQEGKVRQLDVPWARSGSGFTLLFEAFAMELAQAMPLTTVGEIVGEYDKRIMRIVTYYVNTARETVDMSAVTAVGIDETSKAKGHDYVMTAIDMHESKVLFVTEGKDNTTVQRFSQDLVAHGGQPENITQACIDLSPAFIKGVSEQLPNADIVFDRFHVMKLVNDALDSVRREERKDNPLLAGSRYAWLHNPNTATEKQTMQLQTLTTLHLKTARAYRIRLALKDVYDMQDATKALVALNKWYFWVTHSRIPQMIQVAKSIKAHWIGVINYFDTRISNGKTEGINSIIQTIKRRARGYPNTVNFITIIYLICGKLIFDLPQVCGVTHSK